MQKYVNVLSLAVLAIAGASTTTNAALQASASLSLVSTDNSGSTPVYTYLIALQNTGTTTVGTFWYAWVPGEDFLATSPITISSPAGWQALNTHVPNVPTNGYAIQWKASTAGSFIPAGGSLGGFQFTTLDNLASVNGLSPFYPTTPVGTSFVYSGAPFSDAGFQFLVVPEPASLGTIASLGFFVMRRRNRMS